MSGKPNIKLIREAARLALEGQNLSDLTDALWNSEHRNGESRPDVERMAAQYLKLATSRAKAEVNRAFGPADQLGDLFDAIITGQREAIRFPWPKVSRLTQALLPGCVTLLCGDPGATKTFFVLQAFCHWVDAGHNPAMYALEEDATFLTRRALAQRTGEAGLTDEEWVKDNPDRAENLRLDNSDWLNTIGAEINVSPGKILTLPEVSKWIEEKAKASHRIIIVDPITMTDPGKEKPFEADKNLMNRVRSIAMQYGVSVLLVTHPRGGRQAGVFSEDDLAGGRAFGRFSQTILWLEFHESRDVDIVEPFGVTHSTCNRTLHIVKSRNGKGNKHKLAYAFRMDSLAFDEIGMVARPVKKR